MRLCLLGLAGCCLLLLTRAVPSPQAGPGQCIAGRYYGTMRDSRSAASSESPNLGQSPARKPPSTFDEDAALGRDKSRSGTRRQSLGSSNPARRTAKAVASQKKPLKVEAAPLAPSGNGRSAVMMRRAVSGSGGGCGFIGQYLDRAPTPEDWRDAKTTEWLEQYWQKRKGWFKKEDGGFVTVYRREFLGEPSTQCLIGSVESCNFDPCGNARLNAISECDLQPAFNVLMAMRGLKNYFGTLADAISGVISSAALARDTFALTFYKDPVHQNGDAFAFWVTVFNIIVGSAGPLSPVIKKIRLPFLDLSEAPNSFFFWPPHLLANIIVLTLSGMKSPDDPTPRTAAALGSYLRNGFITAKDTYVKAHNDLLRGLHSQGVDFKDVVRDGNLMSFPGFDVAELTKAIIVQVDARTINALWLAQRVFIMGGGPCTESLGLGKGPTEGYHCFEGRAWFISYWAHDDQQNRPFFDPIRNGWADSPPGFDSLGKAPFLSIQYSAVIIASVQAWLAAQGNHYTPEFAKQRLLSYIQSDIGFEFADRGAFAEGTFTIPVCDLTQAAKMDFPHRTEVLQPWSKMRQPIWCGPICGGDWETTREFYKAANFWMYEPPFWQCPEDMRPWKAPPLGRYLIETPS